MPDGIKILLTYRNVSETHAEQIRKVSNKVTVDIATEEDKILSSVEDAEIVLAGMFNEKIFSHSKKLKWVHATGAGVERFLFPEFANSQVVLTNSSGVHRTPMSEMTIAMMLILAKKLNKFMRFQLESKWVRLVTDELEGRTVGILGLGNVGMETAWKAKLLGMRVLALKKEAIRRPAYVDEILRPEELDYLLGESDYIVVTAPSTKETHHMIGERELKLMKPNAYIINVSRGALIDTEALCKALKEGWIAGAGLDVFEEEPLPSDSALWKLENVVITPHVSGSTPHYADRMIKIFCDNLTRYVAGRQLKNVVDKRKGY